MFRKEDDFKREFMQKVNEIHDVYSHKITEKYLNVYCKINKCRFQWWFNYNKDEKGKIVNIKYFRSILS